MERIIQLYKGLTGKEPQSIVPLAGAGSNRQYFRVLGDDEQGTVIAVIGTNTEENQAFIDLAQRFKEGNLPVPAVLGVSDDRMVYLQEDCGDVSLYSFLVLQECFLHGSIGSNGQISARSRLIPC